MSGEEPEGRHASPVPPAGWRGWLGGLLTGAAGGMGINLLSTDLGYRGVAITATAGAVLVGAVRLRRLPDQAPLRTAVSRSANAAAVVCTVVAIAVPAWTGYAVLAAALLTLAAAVLPTDPDIAAATLAGVAAIGVGVAGIGLGTALLNRRDTLAGVAIIGASVAIIGFGAARLNRRDTLAGVAGIGASVAIIGLGTALLSRRDTLAGVAIVGSGVAGIVSLAPKLRQDGAGQALRSAWERWKTDPASTDTRAAADAQPPNALTASPSTD